MAIAEKVLARASGLGALQAGYVVDARIGRLIAEEEFYSAHKYIECRRALPRETGVLR